MNIRRLRSLEIVMTGRHLRALVRNTTSLVALLLFVAAVLPAFAVTRTWTTFGNGNFNDPNNWFYSGIPTAGDFVSFEVGWGIPYKVTFPGNNLAVGGGGTANYATSYLRVRDNGVTFDGSTQSGKGASTYTVASTTMTEANRGIIIGVTPGEDASLNVSHSGIVCCGRLSDLNTLAAILGDAVGAQGTLNMNTGTFNVTGSSSTEHELIVGNHGTGILNVNYGADVSVTGFTGDTSLGNYAQSVGTVNVSGAGSTWYSDWAMHVGRQGRGTFTVQNGGSYTGSITSIGYGTGANGTVNVRDSGSTWTNTSGVFNVGDLGQGFLNVENGGVVNGSFGYLARFPGSVASAVVTGTGSRWNNTSSLFVGGDHGLGGPGGDATLNVSDGGVVAVGGHLHIWDTGTVDGDGTIEGNVINEGVVAPGNASGILTITADYTQRALGEFSVQIFGLNQGTEYDLLDVGGVANLAGILKVDIADHGYTPVVGDTFEIIRSTGGVNGEFDVERFPSIGNNVRLTTIYGTNSVSLAVVPIVQPGDFNFDGRVDGSDFLAWQRGKSPQGSVSRDLSDWRANFANRALAVRGTSVPEPASLLLAIGAAVWFGCQRRTFL